MKLQGGKPGIFCPNSAKNGRKSQGVNHAFLPDFGQN